MSDFKLIAIRTGGTKKAKIKFREIDHEKETDFLKNLPVNTIYRFYNQYSFPQNNFEIIHYHPEREIDLYSIKFSEEKGISINICAIVGENGSGKSSLTELLYWVNYNLGCQFGLLEYKYDELEEDIFYDIAYPKPPKKTGRVITKKYLPNEYLEVQLLYTNGHGKLQMLTMEKGLIHQLDVVLHDNICNIGQSNWGKQITSIDSLTGFFYSLVINYSQYALNALEVGEWINPLFHKNDGYQTPIVLNPKRDNGNIEINDEKQLLSRRLQANILERIKGMPVNSLRNLGNDKIAVDIEITFNPNYLESQEEKYGEITENIRFDFIAEIRQVFLDNSDEFRKTADARLYSYLVEYIYYKLIKITKQYPIFDKYINPDYKKDIPNREYIDVNYFVNIHELLEEIRDSKSHICFKVKGAILHIKYMQFIYPKKNNLFEQPFTINIEKFSDIIFDVVKPKEKYYVNTFMMAMPSFFNVEIIPANDLSFATFSSGEKQRIHSLSSIAYHLVNLNSVEQQKLLSGKAYTNYRYINIILDEIELYFHPDWQRKYISELLNYLSKISEDNLNKIEGVNIVFVTHSPFILSDIPNQNILRLIDGHPQPYIQSEKTFGANIHDLLANDFFMADGFMGEWAKNKINSLIEYLENCVEGNSFITSVEWNQETAKNMIEQIGEPLIRDSIADLYYSILSTSN